MKDISAHLRRRLDHLELQRAGHASEAPPALPWDEFVALPAERRPMFRLDWDSLASSRLPPRDPATIVTQCEQRLQAIEAALSPPAVATSGFVSVPPPLPTEGNRDEPPD